jgi:hypothetical protein
MRHRNGWREEKGGGLAFGRELPDKGGLAGGTASDFMNLFRMVESLKTEESVHRRRRR